MKTTRVAFLCLCSLLGACTMPHSKQALLVDPSTPTERARFVTEEDSGVALFGILTFSEPDHYAVLLERARRAHRCARLHHAQLDYYTDHWIVLAFPISRITVVCEPAPLPTRTEARSNVPAPRPQPALGPEVRPKESPAEHTVP